MPRSFFGARCRTSTKPSICTVVKACLYSMMVQIVEAFAQQRNFGIFIGELRVLCMSLGNSEVHQMLNPTTHESHYGDIH
jgi:hypothetical protein